MSSNPFCTQPTPLKEKTAAKMCCNACTLNASGFLHMTMSANRGVEDAMAMAWHRTPRVSIAGVGDSHAQELWGGRPRVSFAGVGDSRAQELWADDGGD